MIDKYNDGYNVIHSNIILYYILKKFIFIKIHFQRAIFL